MLCSVGVWVTVAVAASSAPARGSLGTWGFLVLLGGLQTSAWLIGVFHWLARSRRKRPERALMTAVIVVVLGVALASSDLPLRARFGASRKSLDHAAAVYRERPLDWIEDPGWIGAYRFSVVERRADGLYFHDGAGVFLGGAGFAYLLAGPPTRSGTWYTHIDGPWYVWSES